MDVNKLIEDNMELVKILAYKSFMNRKNLIDDIISEGYMALIEAANKFNPDMGWKFNTYAAIRIYGRMVDFLRIEDPVGRTSRKRIKAITKAQNDIRARGEGIDDEAIMKETGMTEKEYHYTLPVLKVKTFVSLNEELKQVDGDADTLADLLEDPKQKQPGAELEVQEWFDNLIMGLDDRQKLIMRMKYVEGRYLLEVAELVGISLSRIVQQHNQILGILRNRLRDKGITSHVA